MILKIAAALLMTLLSLTLLGDIVICSSAAPSIFRGILECNLLGIGDFFLLALICFCSWYVFDATPHK